MNSSNERGTIKVEVQKYQYENSIDVTLKNLHFDIKKGEFVGLMGRTGAGKTTTLMLLNGLIPNFFEGNFDGTVISNSMNTQRYRVQTLSRFVGLVMQDPETQIFGITVEKDVAFGPSNLAIEKSRISEIINESLNVVGLNGYKNRISTELSGGEKQRLTIAGVLAMEPEILVLDEPTSELDPEGRREIYKLLKILVKEKNVTVIISGHDSEEMLEFTDRIIVLDKGTIVWNGIPQSLFNDKELAEKYGIMPTGNNSNDLEQINRINEEKLNAEGTLKEKKIMIEARNLSFEYENGRKALKDINLKIFEKEFVSLIGKNGAGKTTFSKQINGLLKPKSGTILINGVDIKNNSTAELSKEIGYVFQNPDHQIFSATVYDEVEYGLKNLKLTEDEREERVKNALEFVGLSNQNKRHPFTLGKGERQKLAVASILAMKPKILVIDEPTTGQDWDGTKRMMELMKKLNSEGTTLITITHNLKLALEYSDRIIKFSDGKVESDFSNIKAI
ncbi:MAG: energy-coupling factor transporter ATPase [Melioribacteraceae bacterium]